MHRVLVVFSWLLLGLAAPSLAVAQGNGSVSGGIADETGGMLPGASVTLRPAGADVDLETVTDGTGTYRFENVPAGQAEVTFRMINFSTVRTPVAVPAGGTVTADGTLFVAASADIVITAPRTFRNLAEIDNPAENLVGIADQ